VAARPAGSAGHDHRAAAPGTPTTGSATTSSTKPDASPCASTAACTTSASAGPSPEPTSSYSFRTSRYASSTPPPASCESSPSTQAVTTSPPADHPVRPEKALARTHESWVRAMPMSCDITVWARQRSNLRPLACKQDTRERCADLQPARIAERYGLS
jgi:hypothetical protein